MNNPLNIRDNTFDTSKIYDLVVKEFNFNPETGTNGLVIKNSTKDQIGLLIDEAFYVDEKFVNLDQDDNPNSIDINRIIYSLLSEMKKLKLKNEELEQKIAVLE